MLMKKFKVNCEYENKEIIEAETEEEALDKFEELEDKMTEQESLSTKRCPVCEWLWFVENHKNPTNTRIARICPACKTARKIVNELEELKLTGKEEK